MTIAEAAAQCVKDGFVPVAQFKRPGASHAKYPKMKGFLNLTRDHPQLRKQGWREAEGIGLLLGPASRNLAVLDLDDVEFSAAVFAKLVRGGLPFRWVHTAHGRGHLHILEQVASPGTSVRRVTAYSLTLPDGRSERRERAFQVELRCQGGLATIPPTPGYTLARDVPPQMAPSIEVVWNEIVRAFRVEEETRGYKAWEDEVDVGTRNQTLFTEARTLARANASLDLMLKLMRVRWQESYEGQMDEKEFQDTVRSAYRYVAKKRAIAASERYEVEKEW